MKAKRKSPKKLGYPGFALADNRGKVKVDTVCSDRESVEFLGEDEIAKGVMRVRRVVVILARNHRA